MKTAQDIFTEPSPIDPDTLANLGPLRAIAGIWESDHADGPRGDGTRGELGADRPHGDASSGLDDHPVAAGGEKQGYVERMELQPIDPQTNGPQLYYGLRYHTHIVKPGEIETFHDQVGYWLWEPATKSVIQTIAIPRAQVAMAQGTAESDARQFELRAQRGTTTFGICSAPFLETAFLTLEFRIRVTILPDGRWSYDETALLAIPGRERPFEHRDRGTLRKVGEPSPNPLAAARARVSGR